jgi:hypothetical protein
MVCISWLSATTSSLFVERFLYDRNYTALCGILPAAATIYVIHEAVCPFLQLSWYFPSYYHMVRYWRPFNLVLFIVSWLPRAITSTAVRRPPWRNETATSHLHPPQSSVTPPSTAFPNFAIQSISFYVSRRNWGSFSYGTNVWVKGSILSHEL